MTEFSVHDLLKETILTELKGYTKEPNEKVPTFFIYEDTAMSLADLAFSFNQFAEAITCLEESELIKFVNEDSEPPSMILLNPPPESKRLDVN